MSLQTRSFGSQELSRKVYFENWSFSFVKIIVLWLFASTKNMDNWEKYRPRNCIHIGLLCHCAIHHDLTPTSNPSTSSAAGKDRAAKEETNGCYSVWPAQLITWNIWRNYSTVFIEKGQKELNRKKSNLEKPCSNGRYGLASKARGKYTMKFCMHKI